MGRCEQHTLIVSTCFPVFSPDDDSVVDGEGVGRETGDVPGADRHLVTEDLNEVELGRAGDTFVADVRHPSADLVLTESRGEGAEVGHLPGRDQYITRQIRVLDRQVLSLLRPSITQQTDRENVLLSRCITRNYPRIILKQSAMSFPPSASRKRGCTLKPGKGLRLSLAIVLN